MHNKFFIVDRKYIWTGSSNISDTGTGGYNANIVALIRSEFLANNYLVEFEQMFHGDFHRAKKRLKKQNIETKIHDQKINLFFSPQGYAMYEGVIPLIKEAKKSIDVAVFFLTHKNVSKELVLAKERGVAVRVILDATAATNGYSKHNYLREHGIKVKVEDWGGKMHMKSALIDNKHLIVGSMNWTSAGESKNDENTLIIRNSNDAPSYVKFYNQMWDSISEKWLHADPKAESIASGTACSDGIDNDFDRLVDDGDAGCRIKTQR
jgi:phosphatidylserine/phosphatidylglycerophosphate/cardiolipin synthase-like enzyme